MNPTLDGYAGFLLSNQGWDGNTITSGFIEVSFQMALEQGIRWFAGIASTIYTQAIYNLATHILILNAPDNIIEEYRVENNIGASPTINNSFSDNSTSGNLMETDAYKNMSISDSNRMLTPYGRAYMAMLPVRPPVQPVGFF